MGVRHAVILAAGRGTRLIPLTDSIPKAMVPFNDSTLIGDGISKVSAHIDHLHVTVGYKKDLLAPHLMSKGVSSVLNTAGKGNAWWIFNTLLKHLDEPVFVLTCDNITELDFDLLVKDYIKQGSPACMLIPISPIEGLAGDYIFEENSVVTELSRDKTSDVYCSGIQILNPHKTNSLIQETDDFGEVWKQLMALKQLRCSEIRPNKWYTVDTPEQLAELHSIYKKEES